MGRLEPVVGSMVPLSIDTGSFFLWETYLRRDMPAQVLLIGTSQHSSAPKFRLSFAPTRKIRIQGRCRRHSYCMATQALLLRKKAGDLRFAQKIIENRSICRQADCMAKADWPGR